MFVILEGSFKKQNQYVRFLKIAKGRELKNRGSSNFTLIIMMLIRIIFHNDYFLYITLSQMTSFELVEFLN